MQVHQQELHTQCKDNPLQHLYQNAITYLTNQQGWVFGTQIGSGLTSRIYKVFKSGAFKQERACKIIVFSNNCKQKKNLAERRKLSYELETMTLSHLNGLKGINNVYEQAKTQDWAYFIMPLFYHGTLQNLLPNNEGKLRLIEEMPQGMKHQKRANTISTLRQQYDSIVQYLLAQLLYTLSNLHARGVIHRDLKLSNIVLDQQFHLFIIDFGLVLLQPENSTQYFPFPTTLLQVNEKLNGRGDYLVGTREYLAPQMISGRSSRIISAKIDIWAVGVIAYQFFSKGKNLPFVGETSSSLNKKIRGQEPDYTAFKPEQAQFLKACFIKNPLERPGANQLLKQKYFQQISFQKIYRTLNPINKLLNPEKFIKKTLIIFDSTEGITYLSTDTSLQPTSQNRNFYNKVLVQIMQTQQGTKCIEVLKDGKNKRVLAHINLKGLFVSVGQCKNELKLYQIQNESKMHWLKFQDVHKMEQFRDFMV